MTVAAACGIGTLMELKPHCPAPGLVAIEVDAANVARAFALADRFRSEGLYVVLGGPQVAAQPDAAAGHADTIMVGPAEQILPRFLREWSSGHPSRRYIFAGAER